MIRFRNVNFLISVLFLAVIFGICLLLLPQIVDFFSVSQIKVIGTKKINGVDSYKGELIFLINQEKMQKKLYDTNPRFQSVLVEKRWPNEIMVNVVENKIIGTLLGGGGYFVLASDGRIVGKSQDCCRFYPLIKSFEKINFASSLPGDKIDSKDILYSLYFTEKLASLNFELQTIDISGFDVLVCKSKESIFYFTTSKDMVLQIDQVRATTDYLRRRGQKLSSIDVRFDKPIIKSSRNY